MSLVARLVRLVSALLHSSSSSEGRSDGDLFELTADELRDDLVFGRD